MFSYLQEGFTTLMMHIKQTQYNDSDLLLVGGRTNPHVRNIYNLVSHKISFFLFLIQEKSIQNVRKRKTRHVANL